jgi:hypothetical protein
VIPESLLTRIRREGAAADVPPADRLPADADEVTRLVLEASHLDPRREADRISALWEQAGRLHDVEALDDALGRVASGSWIPFLGAANRKRLRRAARVALERTTSAGALELAIAVLGETGSDEDAPALEALAVHPAFTLHATTALSNLAHWQGRAALLRLLTRTQGASRVTVIDRLLPHVREPAVRLALVRDALRGLAPEHAAEVAPDIVAMCTVRDCLTDPDAPEDLKEGARLVLAACPPGRQG